MTEFYIGQTKSQSSPVDIGVVIDGAKMIPRSVLTKQETTKSLFVAEFEEPLDEVSNDLRR